MPKAYVACDFEFFPDPPLGGMAVVRSDNAMFIAVKELGPHIATKEVRDARNAENFHSTLEWVRAQRLGG
jgi:hypothetical protein